MSVDDDSTGEPAPPDDDAGDELQGGSAHFKLREFACPHCGVARATPALLQALEKLRAIVGRPIVIVSGYRCPQHNLAVGGAPRSQHLTGRAADIRRGVATTREAERAGFTGIGSLDGSAIHVDVRGSAPARWDY